MDEVSAPQTASQWNVQTPENYLNTERNTLPPKRQHTKHRSYESVLSSNGTLSSPPSTSPKQQTPFGNANVVPTTSTARKRKRGAESVDDDRIPPRARTSEPRQPQVDNIYPGEGRSYDSYGSYETMVAPRTNQTTSQSYERVAEFQSKRQRTHSPRSSEGILMEREEEEEEMPNISAYARPVGQTVFPISARNDYVMKGFDHLSVIAEDRLRETDGEEEKDVVKESYFKTEPYDLDNDQQLSPKDDPNPPVITDQEVEPIVGLVEELFANPKRSRKKNKSRNPRPSKARSNITNTNTNTTNTITNPVIPKRPRITDLETFMKDDETREKEREERAREKEEKESFPTLPNFVQVFFGKWKIKPWYYSPYPALRGADDLPSASAAAAAAAYPVVATSAPVNSNNTPHTSMEATTFPLSVDPGQGLHNFYDPGNPSTDNNPAAGNDETFENTINNIENIPVDPDLLTPFASQSQPYQGQNLPNGKSVVSR